MLGVCFYAAVSLWSLRAMPSGIAWAFAVALGAHAFLIANMTKDGQVCPKCISAALLACAAAIISLRRHPHHVGLMMGAAGLCGLLQLVHVLLPVTDPAGFERLGMSLQSRFRSDRASIFVVAPREVDGHAALSLDDEARLKREFGDAVEFSRIQSPVRRQGPPVVLVVGRSGHRPWALECCPGYAAVRAHVLRLLGVGLQAS